MPPIQGVLWRAVLAALLIAGPLTGCHITRSQKTDPDDMIQSHSFFHHNWQEERPVVETQIEPITFVYLVAFQDGNSTLGPAETDRLVQFLRNIGVHDGARIEIDGPRGQGGFHESLTAARLAQTQTVLKEIGLIGQIPEQPIASLRKPNGGIAITVTRATAILPDCSPPRPERAPGPQFTYSCSSTATLGMMVADPLDLERGRVLDPADGDALSQSIQRYRAGKVYKPKGESTK